MNCGGSSAAPAPLKAQRPGMRRAFVLNASALEAPYFTLKLKREWQSPQKFTEGWCARWQRLQSASVL